MRDATRGGVASVLNEIAEASNVCIRVKEKSLPYKEELRGFCEILGLDPLYMANEGKVVVIAAAEDAQRLLETMRQHELGRNSAIIGEVVEQPASTVILETVFGANRMVDKLMGEQLPRIC
jgi:hydrogenase expression/formation protein HypE